ncbi:serine hydrolase [Amycolatopsis saalfeldensis]|uniref:Beta-lactamase enzyme family protein n=1 Tax=Amycolatopsis saalfeldensis TaxID=394193 RepID=A0A1H8YEL4_9PSEU|nr:serine hydrolase [Amycolatopsis saalfeldensis]SEP50522.1 Beta-lactamase enzyme family protein [Amycolatopsis saalfeldensis]
MLKHPGQLKVRVGIAALIVVIGVVTAIALNSGSASSQWTAACSSAPTEAGDKPESAVTEAREALLSKGKDPRLELELVDLDACAVRLSWKADQPQPTASVVKLLIALDLIDRSGLPEGSEATDLHTMLAASDDHIASRLWLQDGGPAIVQRQAKKLGLTHTSPPADTGQWGSTRMSPADVITVYRHITAELPEDERDFITEAMESAPRNAADGFDQHFGIPRAFPGADWAVKQGWGSSDGRRVLNTTGLVRTGSRTFALAVMATWDDSIDWATATTALTAATSTLKSRLTAGGSLLR